MKQVNEYIDHKERVGTIAWGNPILASGSRDKNIIFRDLRMPKITQISKRVAHKQEICGLEWSPNYQQLASGGNDNKLFI